MKKISLVLGFISLNVSANDSLIQLLEDHDISTEAFVATEEVFEFSGAELKHGVSQMMKRSLLLQYTVTDHDSSTGQCLEKAIVKVFKQGSAPMDPSRFGHCGGIFDPPGSMNESTEVVGVDAHALKHQQQVILAKKYATSECNKDLRAHVPKVPVFTAPQPLVDIIYNLRSPSRGYHLADGLTFHCISPLTTAGH